VNTKDRERDWNSIVRLAEMYVRESVYQSARLSVDIADLVEAVIIVSYRITGHQVTEEELTEVARNLDENIHRSTELEDFENSVMNDLEDLPVIETTPRVLISKADAEVLADVVASRVAEILRDQEPDVESPRRHRIGSEGNRAL
jgi:hypothetical protein